MFCSLLFIVERVKCMIQTPYVSSGRKLEEQYFRITDAIPEEVWYWAAVNSILVSAALFASNKRDWSLFVGEWPPTFLLFGLFHKLLRSR
jgi:hypothetical protein